MPEKNTDSNHELSFAELKELAIILRSAPELRHFSLKFKNLELAIETGLGPSATAEQSSPLSKSPGNGLQPLLDHADPSNNASASLPIDQTKPRDTSSLLESSGTKLAHDPSHVVVTSPMIGTYYKAPQPGAKPFVKVGDLVKAGDVVCLIEVMKLINSVITDVDGTVVAIHVDDAQAVEHGQPLISIQKN